MLSFWSRPLKSWRRAGDRADHHAIAERILSITGEDAITIDRKHASAWTGQLQTRFFVISNELPRLADASGALVSRFIVLLLTKSFYGQEDQELTAKLLTELPAILNWSIAGWHRLAKFGHFKQPASVLGCLIGMSVWWVAIGHDAIKEELEQKR